MGAIKLIVGLGNPGREYAETRHNAGFWWIDALARTEGATLRSDAKFHGLVARIGRPAGDIWLLEPETFMNASGRSVAAIARFYKVAPEEILVVHDELDLPPGTARIKKGGGHGGHNGLRDIGAHLGTNDYWRLRLGIGHPGDRNQVVKFVLQPPTQQEAILIEDAMARSLALFPLLATGEFPAAMHKLHTKEKTQ